MTYKGQRERRKKERKKTKIFYVMSDDLIDAWSLLFFIFIDFK